MEAMAIGPTIRSDAKDLGLDQLGSEQEHDPLYRPDKFCLACPPAHALRNGKRYQRLCHQLWDKRLCRLAYFSGTKCKPASIIGFKPLQRLHRNATRARKPEGCLGWPALSIKGCTQGRTALDNLLIGLGGGYLLNEHGQAAWGGINTNGTVIEPEL